MTKKSPAKVPSKTARQKVKKPARRASSSAKPARKLQHPKINGKRPAAKVQAARKAVEVKKVTPTKLTVPKVQPKAVVAPPKAPIKPPAGPAKILPKSAPLKQGLPPVVRPPLPAGTRTMPIVNKLGPKILGPKAAAGPAAAGPAAEKAAAARQQPPVPKKPVHQRHGFKTNEWIVYPAHGVGRIVGIEEQDIAGVSLELFVITFEKDKMTLRVPTGKSQSVGMRKLAEEATVKRAMETLKGRARIKRTMWSRRAQEYDAKINSGDLIAIAEVVRDLYRSESQPEQSYSERQLYEAALDRMAREIAAVEKLDERGAVQRITEVLSKSARGRRLAAEEAEEKARAA